MTVPNSQSSRYFAAAMADLNYDINKLPLGKLAKSTITKGYQALKDLSDLLNDPALAQSEYDTSYDAAVEQLSNSYYSYIPHGKTPFADSVLTLLIIHSIWDE